MPIVGHYLDENETLILKVSSPEYNIMEELSARQILGLEPEQIEVYEYFYNDIQWSPEPKITTLRKSIQTKFSSMILDYMDVGHWNAAMDLIETSIIGKRRPSIAMTLALFDLMLKPASFHKQRRQYVRLCQRAERLLYYMLETFGPSHFNCVWSLFGNTDTNARKLHQASAGTQGDSDDEAEEHGNNYVLSEYIDFWMFISACFESDQLLELQTQGRRRVAKLLISVLEHDLRERQEEPGKLEKSTFLSMLRKDTFGYRDQFDRYLEILFAVFERPQLNATSERDKLNEAYTEGTELAGRLLNMLIILSYSANLVMTSALVQQTYRRFSYLSTEAVSDFLQIIQCNTFISALCDMVLMDCDYGCVEKEYRHFRKQKGTTLSMDRLFHYVMKTRPLQRSSMDEVCRHVLIVLHRFMSFMSECSLRCDTYQVSSTGEADWDHQVYTGILEREIVAVIERAPEALESWRKHVEAMVVEARQGEQQDEARTKELEEKIWWAFHLATLNFDIV